MVEIKSVWNIRKMVLLSILVLSLFRATDYSYAQVSDSLFHVREKQVHNLVLAKRYTTASLFINDLANDPRVSSEALLDCIESAYQMKYYEKTISLCDKWMQLFPYNVDTQVNYYYGKAYFELRDYKKAKAYLSRVIRRKDLDDSIVLLYANTLFNDCNYKDAITYYKQYLDNKQRDNYAGEDLGEVYLQYAISTITQGKEQEGLVLLRKAAALGDSFAKELDYSFSNSEFFAKDIDLKPSTISSIQKDIRTFDIPELKQETKGRTASSFWSLVADNSSEHQRVLKVMRGKKRVPKAFQYAYRILEEMRPAQESALRELKPYPKGDIEDVFEKTLFNNNYTCDIRIYPADEVNAFTTPYGQIYLTTGLFKQFQYVEPFLVAVCAHEATHYKCEHSLLEGWTVAEKNRKAALWAEIASGLYTISMAGASAALEISSGVSSNVDYKDIATISRSIEDAFFEDAYYFKYRYSRSQEIEADIIAYRFCENMGIGGYSFIAALELLGDNDVYMKAEKTSDHPTTAYRIALLKYLWKTEHPETN